MMTAFDSSIEHLKKRLKNLVFVSFFRRSSLGSKSQSQIVLLVFDVRHLRLRKYNGFKNQVLYRGYSYNTNK